MFTEIDVTLQPSSDYALIRKIMTAPKVWERMTDDFTPPQEHFRLQVGNGRTYVLAHIDGEIAGVFLAVELTPVMYEIHACLLPWVAGWKSTVAARRFIDSIWRYSQALRIIAPIPDFNKAAQKKAKLAGMTVYGINENAFLKNGLPGSLILFGINRNEAPLCPS